MTGKPSLVDEIEALVPLHLEGLREIWRDRFGAPPKLRSAELLRHCMAWRLQAEALWTHPGKVEAPYTVCIASASNLTGLVKSSVECRRTGL